MDKRATVGSPFSIRRCKGRSYAVSSLTSTPVKSSIPQPFPCGPAFNRNYRHTYTVWRVLAHSPNPGKIPLMEKINEPQEMEHKQSQCGARHVHRRCSSVAYLWHKILMLDANHHTSDTHTPQQHSRACKKYTATPRKGNDRYTIPLRYSVTSRKWSSFRYGVL